MKKVIITTGAIALVGGVITAVTMSSCDPCEPIDKPSVIVTLVDQDATGVAHVDAKRVWYEFTNEEGEVITEEAECLDRDGETGACVDWQVGHGRQGTYDFHAEVCGQIFESSITLEVNKEGCDVDTHSVDLAVSTGSCPTDFEAPEPPLPQFPPPQFPEIPPWQAPTLPQCTLEARFSVVATVLADLGDNKLVPVRPDKAYYTYIPADGIQPEVREGRDKQPAMCADRDCNNFIAGVEQEGKFTIGAEVCGHVVKSTVEVGRTKDLCHVETQRVFLTFDAKECHDEIPTLEAEVAEPHCPVTGPIPSAYLMPTRIEGDLMYAVPTEELTFIQRGFEREAQGYCAHPVAAGCSLWIAGWDTTGDFKAFTSTCGVESSVLYTVEESDDRCGPKTAWVPLSVNTRGCITAPSPEGNPPPSTPGIDGDIKAPAEPDPSDVKAP